MKIVKSFFLILGFLILAGCGVEDLIPGLGSTMTAKVDGNDFDATGVAATRTPAAGGLTEGYTVGGNASSSFYPAITLTLYSTTTGTYNLGGSASNAPFATYSESAINQEVSISGTITITSIDYTFSGKVQGTFAFETGVNSITEGSFEATFAN